MPATAVIGPRGFSLSSHTFTDDDRQGGYFWSDPGFGLLNAKEHLVTLVPLADCSPMVRTTRVLVWLARTQRKALYSFTGR